MRALKLSLGANAAMVVLVVWMAHRSSPVTSPVAQIPLPADSQPSPALSGTNNQSTLASFRWNQLESTNYRTYVGNLRGIGCPQRTIYDIISTDLDEAWYAERRQRLWQQLSQTASSFADEQSRRAAGAELDRLNREEAAVIANLLGTNAGPAEFLTGNSSLPERHNRFAGTPAQIPLAFQKFDTSSLGFTADEADYFQAVQQMFQQEIGGTNQDPADPAYRERWQAAQRDADSALRGMLGRRRYEEYEAQASQAADEK